MKPRTARWLEFYLALVMFVIGATALVADDPRVHRAATAALSLFLIIVSIIIARSALSND